MTIQSTMKGYTIPCKSNNLPSTEITNPRHKAPIPFFPLPTTDPDDESEVKLKLRCNPDDDDSPTFEKAFKPFYVSTAKEYCKFRVMFDKIVQHVPLNMASQKFAQITTLLTGMSKSNWDTAVTNIAG